MAETTKPGDLELQALKDEVNAAIAKTPILAHFEAAHLPEPLRGVSVMIGQVAFQVAATIDSDPELTMGLRKLLEAKDCLVRATIITLRRRAAALEQQR
jgi:hypothetical protein